MERLNIGLMQSMVDLKTESLLEAINKIMNNETYYKSIENVSNIFKSNQNDPLDTAIYWIQYIIKHKGAPHLQSHAKNLPWYRYLLLDVFLVVFGGIYIIFDVLKQIVNFLTKKQPQYNLINNKNKKKKKQ